MRIRKRIICIVFALFGLLLDTSVLPYTGLNPQFVPRLCLTFILLVSIVSGATEGMITGALCGYLGDITVYQPVGLIAISYTLAALIAGFTAGKMRVRLVTIIPPLITYFLFECTMLLYTYFSTGFISMPNFWYGLIRMMISFVIIQLLYIPAVHILKPERIGRKERRAQRGR